MVPPEVSYFSFHSAFLVAFGPIAELRVVAPVRAEGEESLRFFALPAAQHLLHRTLQVVVAQHLKHSAKIRERQLMAFQKRLLRGVRVGYVKPASAGHAAHREKLQ